MTRTDIEQRAQVITLLEEGYSTHAVASRVGINQSTVVRIGKRKDDTGSNKDRYRSGRPRLLNKRDERNAVRLISTQQCSTAVEVQRELSSHHNTVVSAQTVRRVLTRNGLCARVFLNKAFLSKRHKASRLSFAKKYKNWTVEDWRKVVWSDESKFQIFGSDGRKYCWKKPGEQLRDAHVNPTVKHGGGSIMVWSCMISQGPGFICKIDHGLDAELYQLILSDDLMESLKWYNISKKDMIFQHDNDPKHTAKSTQAWLKKKKVKVLNWPSQSPDLNPIEHLWNEADRRLRNLRNPPTSAEDLWGKLQGVWNKIEPDFCDKLVKTMPQRMKDVIKAKGSYTRW
jgi:transposase